jgi:hypothetical protein
VIPVPTDRTNLQGSSAPDISPKILSGCILCLQYASPLSQKKIQKIYYHMFHVFTKNMNMDHFCSREIAEKNPKHIEGNFLSVPGMKPNQTLESK